VSETCHSLYRCNRWNCKACSSKKLYWLREQALQFSRCLALDETSFITLKGFRNAVDCEQGTKLAIEALKGNSKRLNDKLEYFFVISNHEFSGWHSHIIVNSSNFALTANVEPTRNLKSSVLYLVANLERSMSADYGRVRRYGGSSLLNKQSMKRWFKTRVRLWNIKTAYVLAMLLYRWLSNRDGKRSRDKACSWRESDHRFYPVQNKFMPLVERPPPRNQICH